MKNLLTLVPDPSTNLSQKVLKDQELVLGRVELNNCSFISTKHFKIYRENNEFYLEDMSTNGTHLNNELIKKKKKQIAHFDKISLPIEPKKLFFKFCYTVIIQKEEEQEEKLDDVTQEGSYPTDEKKRKRDIEDEIVKNPKKEVNLIEELFLLQKKQNEIFKKMSGKYAQFKDDIILQIIEFLDVKDLSNGSIFLVSKQFYKISQNNEFWKKLTLQHFDNMPFNDINWKEYFQLRSSKESESENKILKFLKDPEEVLDIYQYIEGYKKRNDYEYITMVKYFQNPSEIYSKFYIWSLKFPICVEIIIYVSEKKCSLLIDESEFYLGSEFQEENLKLDSLLLENARESLGHDYLQTNDDLIKYIKTICEFNEKFLDFPFKKESKNVEENHNFSLVI